MSDPSRMMVTWSRVRPKDQLLVGGVVWRCTDTTGGKYMLKNQGTGQVQVGQPSPTREVMLLMPADPLYVREPADRMPAGVDVQEAAVAFVQVRLGGSVVGMIPSGQDMFTVPPSATTDLKGLRLHLTLFHGPDVDWASVPDDGLADMHHASDGDVAHFHEET